MALRHTASEKNTEQPSNAPEPQLRCDNRCANPLTHPAALIPSTLPMVAILLTPIILIIVIAEALGSACLALPLPAPRKQATEQARAGRLVCARPPAGGPAVWGGLGTAGERVVVVVAGGDVV